jgi:hypothetical protein
MFIPLLFLFLALIFTKFKIKELGRHNLRLYIIFNMIFIGSLLHLILDVLFGESFYIFYPFSNIQLGLNLINFLPLSLQSLAMPSLDAVLLILWLIYLELKHKISDFI